MKPIATAIAVCALLLGSAQSASASQRETEQVVKELTALQYKEQSDNPTIGVRHQGETAVILKRKGTGACAKAAAWRDAVHRSAWFGKISKCWTLARPDVIKVCPIANAALVDQSCFDIPRDLFVASIEPAFK